MSDSFRILRRVASVAAVLCLTASAEPTAWGRQGVVRQEPADPRAVFSPVAGAEKAGFPPSVVPAEFTAAPLPAAGGALSLPAALDPDAALSPGGLTNTLKILGLLTVLSLAPSILIMTTCFVRFVIVFGLLKQAIGTQQLPPEPGGRVAVPVPDGRRDGAGLVAVL